MDFNQEEFDKFVIDAGTVGIKAEEFTLASGQKSNWYVNWRSVMSDVYQADKVSDFVISFAKVKGIEADCFFGVPEGATKLGLITTYKLAKQSPDYAPGSHVFSMGRGKPKEHGDPKDKFYVGAPKGKVCVLEDVTTTGGSLAKALAKLKETGVEIVAVISLTHRMEKRPDDNLKVEDYIKKEFGVDCYWLSEGPKLLPKVYELQKAGLGDDAERIAKSIEQEFEERGAVPVKLL